MREASPLDIPVATGGQGGGHPTMATPPRAACIEVWSWLASRQVSEQGLKAASMELLLWAGRENR